MNYTNKTSTQDYIYKAIKKHGFKYDYSLVDYKNSRTKITISCKLHGNFLQNPNQHLRGHGCPKCGKVYKPTLDEVINKLKIIHKNKYDYSLVKYKTNKDKIKIICPTHGIFEQVAQSHLNGVGCSNCSGKKKYTLNDFIWVSNEIHDNRYDYSLSVYGNRNIKLTIICPLHGEFKQTPYVHTKGHGCPSCNHSKGENLIKNILQSRNISYQTQYTFKDCKYKLPLRFDFYLPECNTCIEFDGKQHFEPHFKDVNGIEFSKTKKRDKIKNEYCLKNNIKLIRIRYDENISNVLNKILN